MAGVTELRDVCGSLIQNISKIGEYQEDWCTLPADYEIQAEDLRSRLNFFVNQAQIHGQPANSSMMKVLTRALAALEKAELRLKQLEEVVDSDSCCFSGWWLLYARLSMIFFPGKLEKVFKKLTDEIEKIPKVLKDEVQEAALTQQADSRRAAPTIIYNNDDLYVPIEESQSAVMRAIEDFDGPPIIMLHGGVGKGKSTLARFILKSYGEKGDAEKRNLFEYVLFVGCSNSGPDPSTKQFEILAHLSPDSLGTHEIQEQMVGAKSRIARALQSFFNGKRVLVVLDDVSDVQFLHGMWKAVTGTKLVKYLVTSQTPSVCRNVKNECLLIAMQDPTTAEASMILASLVGLKGKVIPPELQVCLHNLLCKLCLLHLLAVISHTIESISENDLICFLLLEGHSRRCGTSN